MLDRHYLAAFAEELAEDAKITTGIRAERLRRRAAAIDDALVMLDDLVTERDSLTGLCVVEQRAATDANQLVWKLNVPTMEGGFLDPTEYPDRASAVAAVRKAADLLPLPAPLPDELD